MFCPVLIVERVLPALLYSFPIVFLGEVDFAKFPPSAVNPELFIQVVCHKRCKE